MLHKSFIQQQIIPASYIYIDQDGEFRWAIRQVSPGSEYWQLSDQNGHIIKQGYLDECELSLQNLLPNYLYSEGGIVED